MTAPAISLDTMRADVARIIGEDPSEIGDDDNLIDFGLDSIRVMTLIQRWGEKGLKLDFAQLAEKPTLAHWWSVASRHQAE
ncbi:phosphopantetheine-binding protein [Pseudochelatococcus contaminans]|uniref:Aryl carrier-like protein n=1 Tax=Pseudochelatococcus contaminans TaxID=1538103 RepID=A0A7W5Z1K3_9HYPH|nr:phosphopantetheine-binding protein [Pseudochelatococcus contaminans]MBB3808081.1 aryl carrier-like protein [Pseudochelatococcus contaminans]